MDWVGRPIILDSIEDRDLLTWQEVSELKGKKKIRFYLQSNDREQVEGGRGEEQSIKRWKIGLSRPWAFAPRPVQNAGGSIKAETHSNLQWGRFYKKIPAVGNTL